MNGLNLSSEQQALLKAIAEHDKSEVKRRHARILLDSHNGLSSKQIAEKLGISERSVRHWRQLFQQRGMDIFKHTQADIGNDKNQNAETPPKSSKKTKILPIEKKDKMPIAGVKIFRYCLKQIIAHEDGTRKGEDIEELHDMRVATRRLRAALRLFTSFFPKKEIKRIQKEAKTLGQTLGRVRDLDVFMENAKQDFAELEGVTEESLEPLLTIWEEDHSAARREMIAYLDSGQYQQFIKDLSSWVEDYSEKEGDELANGIPQPSRVEEWLPILVYQRFAEIRAFDPIIEKATYEQLHALRRAFKMFRYTIEFFSGVLSAEETQYIINACKRIQDHLGALNDAHNACMLIERYKKIVEERQNALPLNERPNLSIFLIYLLKKEEQRHKLLSSFAETWLNFMSTEIKENLSKAVSKL